MMTPIIAMSLVRTAPVLIATALGGVLIGNAIASDEPTATNAAATIGLMLILADIAKVMARGTIKLAEALLEITVLSTRADSESAAMIMADDMASH